MARRWLGQVDAMRPIKQAGVVSTHSILYFAPAAASVGSGAALLLLHVSREGFFFISACMLTYAYADLRLADRAGLRRFYRRRIVSVVIPYLCWTGIYFFYLLPTSHYAERGHGARAPGPDGRDRVLPAVLPDRDHAVLPGVPARAHAAAADPGASWPPHRGRRGGSGGDRDRDHWQLFPALMHRYAQQDALSYLLYLIGGGVVAFHLDEVHAWVCGHARLILTLTAAAALAAEGIYFLAQQGVTTVLGSGNDPFQPSVIPFNVGAIACGYLAGVALVRPERSRRAKAAVRAVPTTPTASTCPRWCSSPR